MVKNILSGPYFLSATDICSNNYERLVLSGGFKIVKLSIGIIETKKPVLSNPLAVIEGAPIAR